MRRLCLRLRAVRLLSRMQRSEQGSVVALALVVGVSAYPEQGSVVALALVVAVGGSAHLLLLQPIIVVRAARWRRGFLRNTWKLQLE